MDKCLHILPMNKFSGAEKVVLLISENLINFEPIIICGGEKLASVFEKKDINTFNIDFSRKLCFGNMKQISKIIKKNNINIVHAHDNLASIYAYTAKVIFGLDLKIISHIHNCYPFLNRLSLNKYIDKILRKKYNYNIACGKLVYNYYLNKNNMLDRNKISYLSNAIDISKIEKIRYNRDEIKSKFKINGKFKILGFVGRLDEQKGLKEFLVELSKNKNNFKNCKIIIVGSGSLELDLKKIVTTNDLQDMVIFTGYQNDPFEVMSIFDVFFLPSLYEGLPMVLLEAIAFQKLIVSMDVGSISEIIKNEYSGYLVEKGNYQQFINTLKTSLEEDEERIKMFKMNAIDIVKTDYDIKEYITKLERVYYDTLRGEKRCN